MRIDVRHLIGIEHALAQVNGRAAAHTVSAADLDVLSRKAEAHLEALCAPKVHRQGARLVYQPPGPGKAYARKAHSVATTRVAIERGARTWFLVAADRVETWATASELYELTLPPAALAPSLAGVYAGVVLPPDFPR